MLGQDIQAGVPVFLALGSANLDPDAHPDPNQFRPDRDHRQAMTFGRGRHSCIGAALARMQIGIMLRELLSVGVVRADSNPIEYHARFGHRWPVEMAVRA